MTESKPEVKPWSRKKRVMTAAGLSAMIFALALLVGGGLYIVGGKWQLIDRQDLKDVLMEQAMEDEALAKVVMDEIKFERCNNEVWGFELKYDPKVMEMVGEGEEYCRKFTTKISTGEVALLRITPWEVERNEAVEIVVSGMEQVVTDSYGHEAYEGVVVGGLKEGKVIKTIVLFPSPGLSLVLEAVPADPISEQRLEQLAKSLVYMRQ